MKLITGHKGFIGQNLVKRFDEYLGVGKDEISGCFENISWKEISEIWHIGAISDTTCTDLELIHFYNVKMSLALFEKAIEYQIPVKYASSASVYGNSGGYYINPLNHYAMSKAIVDLWIQDNMKRFSKIQSYRFFNVYGDHEEHKGNQASPVHTFTKQARETKVVKLFENSYSYVRDFIWVEDVIDCMMESVESGIYDVGTSKPISFEEVGWRIAEKYKARIEYIKFPEHLKGKYQEYTCAKRIFNRDFTTVEQYMKQKS
jgi:ADP-L-glycero-D-manno-heptose 6-epimerase